MQTNYMGQVALTKAVLPAMLHRKSGHLVVISSVSGKIGAPNRSAYAASKHALHGFFDSLRAEVWRDGIKVTLVCPGFVRTNIRAAALQGDGTPRGDKALPYRNAVSAQDCAAATLSAIVKGKEEVYIGREALAVYAGRLFPGLVSQIVRRMKDI
jgi:dehydrogenase/reductase SDR family protein 7B